MRIANVLAVLALASASAGCTAITSGDFEERRPPRICGSDESLPRRDMVVTLTQMSAHVGNLVSVELVRIEGAGPLRMRRLVARSIYAPLGAPDLDIELPCTVLDGNHEVDVFADLNNSMSYDPCPSPPDCADHQWRLMLQADGTLSYQHDIDFVNIANDAPIPRGALPVRAMLSNMSRYAGLLAEVRVRHVIADVAEETVFRFRTVIPTDVTDAPFPLGTNGLIELRERYEVAIWIDLNGNRAYDPPSSIGLEGRDYATSIDALGEPTDGVLVLFDGADPPPVEDIEL
jgi:hypothetical protein